MKTFLASSSLGESEIIIQKEIPTHFKSKKKYQQIIVFYDRKLKKSLSDLLKNPDINFIAVSGGEKLKSLESYQKIIAQLIKLQANRSSALIAIGGGTVGDAIGYVAASFKRGLDWYFVPTTTLSMIDSSVGGKVALNFDQYKNMIGAFYSPKQVYIALDFLETLPARDYRAGYVELIKHALLQNKRVFKESLASTELTESKIFESLRFKAALVQRDPYDIKGIRSSLNLGHTLGHAFEMAYKLRHGEAIYHGLIMEIQLANRLGLLAHHKAQLILQALDQLKMPPLKLTNKNQLKKYLTQDKKNSQQDVFKLVLLTDFGKTQEVECTWQQLNWP